MQFNTPMVLPAIALGKIHTMRVIKKHFQRSLKATAKSLLSSGKINIQASILIKRSVMLAQIILSILLLLNLNNVIM